MSLFQKRCSQLLASILLFSAGLPATGGEVAADSVPNIQHFRGTADVQIFGLQNQPLGQAVLQPQGGHLHVSNIGSSGKDGVSINMPPSEGGSVLLAPATCPPGPLSPGSGLGLGAFNVDSFFDIEYELVGVRG